MKGTILVVDDGGWVEHLKHPMEEREVTLTWYKDSEEATDAINRGLRYELGIVGLPFYESSDDVIKASIEVNPETPLWRLYKPADSDGYIGGITLNILVEIVDSHFEKK